MTTDELPLLITGAPGWLSDAVLSRVSAVLSKPKNVRCLVQQSISSEHIAAWRARHPEVIEIIRGEFGDYSSLESACADMRGGVVFHAAGVIHPRRTREWYKINRDGTLRLAAAAKSSGAKRFVYVSSNAAQGVSQGNQPLTEAMPCHPLSHYGRSKREAEEGLLRLHEHGRFDVVILRPCMFYGPGAPRRHAEIFQRIQHGRMPLVGGGKYARSISYIEDLADGVILSLHHPRAAGEIFNLCDSQIYTTREICDAMAVALEVTPRYVHLPHIASSVANCLDGLIEACGFYNMPLHLLGEANWNAACSNQKAKDLLGYKPEMSLVEGYRRAVAWSRQQKMLGG